MNVDLYVTVNEYAAEQLDCILKYNCFGKKQYEQLLNWEVSLEVLNYSVYLIQQLSGRFRVPQRKEPCN